MSLLDLNPSTRASLVVRIRNPRDDQAWAEVVTVYEQTFFGWRSDAESKTPMREKSSKKF
jgi:hypothetical protein